MTLTPAQRFAVVAAVGAIEAAARAAGVPLPPDVVRQAQQAIERAALAVLQQQAPIARELHVLDMRGRQTGTLDE